MAVYKNESNNTWYVMTRYQDWTGERKQKWNGRISSNSRKEQVSI